MDARPYTPEMIDQDVAPEPQQQLPLSPREKKQMEKEEKERIRREKEQDKLRKKEEEKERKRLEKEKKALLAAEKKASKQKSKQKGKPKKEIERRDSKSSADIGRDWDEARDQDHPGSVTPERTIKRFSSFEERQEKGVDIDEDGDRPPTPPEPLDGSLKGRQKGRRREKKGQGHESEGSDYASDDDHLKEPRRRGVGHDEEEEVSF